MSEEFIEPTRQSRRNLLLVYAALVIGFVFLQSWAMPAFFDYGKSLPPCDQVIVLIKAIIATLLFPVAIGIWGVFHARKLIELKQFPLPGTWVFRRKLIKRGRAIRYRAYALLVLSVVLIVLCFASLRFIKPVFMSLAMKHNCSDKVSLGADGLRHLTLLRLAAENKY